MRFMRRNVAAAPEADRQSMMPGQTENLTQIVNGCRPVDVTRAVARQSPRPDPLQMVVGKMQVTIVPLDDGAPAVASYLCRL
jgi:hypothetical protein